MTRALDTILTILAASFAVAAFLAVPALIVHEINVSLGTGVPISVGLGIGIIGIAILSGSMLERRKRHEH
jgi:hypothetical protein